VKKIKYPPEFKAEVCEYAKKESIVYASILYNIHRNTIGNWVKKYKNSGIKGFTVIRKDTQETKLDKAILDRIARYKRRNPKATLKMIREKFDLDCHITLIGRKLKKVYQPVKRKKQKETLFLQTKIIRNVEYKDSYHPVFRLSLHLCSGKPISVGFSSWYSSEKICLFIRYSLEKLKMLKAKHIIKKIITSTKFIKNDDFATLVSNYHDIELQIVKAGEYKVCSDDGIYFSEKGLKHSMIESYDRILEDLDSHELNNVLLTSLVNINELSKKDFTGKEWDSLFMPAETKKSFYNALEKIKEKGNKAVLEFDYETAKNEYHKAYSAMTALKVEDENMYLSILSEKAKLYYNIEQYQTALMLYRDISRVSRSEDKRIYLGEAYYHIAMIFRVYQDITGSVKYFRLSAKTLSNLSDIMYECMFCRAKYNEYLVQGKYKETEKFSELYYKSALKTQDKKLIGNCLSCRGAYLFSKGKYDHFEKMLIEAKKYNITNGNYYEAGKNLTNLFSIYSYYIIKDENEINILFNELKTVSEKINMHNLVFESMLRLGIFYYNKLKYKDSLKILQQALPGVKEYLDEESYLSNLCYLGRAFYVINETEKAVRHFSKLKIESSNNKNYNYLLQAHHYLTEIYLKRNDLRRASKLVRNSICYSEKIENLFYCGDFHLFYAKICEKKSMKSNALFHYKEALKCFKICINDKYALSDEIVFINSKIEYLK
jgi:tetratricopeptide (TPR) repeat protein/transposase-like protein